eukprot:13972863-Heterocapsa_arctica.AAC.1
MLKFSVDSGNLADEWASQIVAVSKARAGRETVPAAGRGLEVSGGRGSGRTSRASRTRASRGVVHARYKSTRASRGVVRA